MTDIQDQKTIKAKFNAAVYAGSFAPITKGHHDIILQAAKMFERLYIVVGVNASKKPLFDQGERIKMIEKDVKTHIQPKLKKAGIDCEIIVTAHKGATARFMAEHDAPYYVRGLRLATEFDGESTLVRNSQRIYKDFTPVLFMSSDAHLETVSSSAARELARLGEDKALGEILSVNVKKKLIKRMDDLGLRIKP